jgi:tetratricopeptide (TPR) repeat protein
LDNYEVAINCNNLAALCQAKGNSTEAEQLYRRALAIKRKILGPHHPDVAVTLNNLAVLHKSQSNYGKADRAYRRALVILKKSFGPSHPQVAICKENYGKLLEHMKMEGIKC